MSEKWGTFWTLWLSLMLVLICFSRFSLKFRSRKWIVRSFNVSTNVSRNYCQKLSPDVHSWIRIYFTLFFLWQDNAQPSPCHLGDETAMRFLTDSNCCEICVWAYANIMFTCSFLCFSVLWPISVPILYYFLLFYSIIIIFPETSQFYCNEFYFYHRELKCNHFLNAFGFPLYKSETVVSSRKYTRRDTATNGWCRWRKFMLICQKKNIYKAESREEKKTSVQTSCSVSHRLRNPTVKSRRKKEREKSTCDENKWKRFFSHFRWGLCGRATTKSRPQKYFISRLACPRRTDHIN